MSCLGDELFSLSLRRFRKAVEKSSQAEENGITNMKSTRNDSTIIVWEKTINTSTREVMFMALTEYNCRGSYRVWRMTCYEHEVSHTWQWQTGTDDPEWTMLNPDPFAEAEQDAACANREQP